MVDYKYKDLFTKSHVDKQLRIATDDGLFVATNEDIHFEDFELTESLCSDSELRFGSCEASMVKFQIRNAFIPLAGKWITITETLEGNTNTPFQYGRYKVFSDVPTADKEYRDIVSYDAMYDILNADVSDWYNTILPQKDSKVTMKKLRESFIQHFGLTEVVPKDELVNDGMTVEKTIEPSEISGKDVIIAICEINGCFGHIGRDGKFHYIYLQQNIGGLYPANNLYPDHAPNYLPQAETGHLYPQDPKGERMGAGRYKKCQYEDYIVRQINKLQIRQEENDIGVIYGNGDNCYIIQDNFLVYGKGTEELQGIAKNIYDKITGIIYRPFDAECQGNPCLEVGAPIRFLTKYHIVESYILKRTLKRIQSLSDSYSASGSKKRTEKVNGIQKSIVQLKGKTNVLERSIEETKSTITDVEKGLQSQITQNAEKITAEVKRSENAEKQLNSKIEQTATSITTTVAETYETKQDSQTKANALSSEIKQTAHQISLTVLDNNTSAGIQIQLKNKNGEIIDTSSGTITMTGLVSFESLSTAGKTVINGENITTGTINCNLLNGGEITGQKINGGELSMPKKGPGMKIHISNDGQTYFYGWQYALDQTGVPDTSQWIPWTYNAGDNINAPYGVCHIYGIDGYLMVVFEADSTGKRWCARFPWESFEYVEENIPGKYPII